MLHIYYGKGKGKTTAALGLIIRAAGHNKRIVLFQFLKPKSLFCGEYASLKKFPRIKQIRFNQKHPIFICKKGKHTLPRLATNIQSSLDALQRLIAKGDFDMLICDEILNIIHKECVQEKRLVALFQSIRKKKEIILTGRKKPKALVKIADYITQCRCIKHPFSKGILARKGIEF